MKLKRHGKDLLGLCPFHDDKTRVSLITPEKNLWHCLGACQAGGTVIDWVMRVEGVSFRYAVELLRAGSSLFSCRKAADASAAEESDEAEASGARRAERGRRGAAARGGGVLPPDAEGEPGGARVSRKARDPKRGSDRAVFSSALRTARSGIGLPAQEPARRRRAPGAARARRDFSRERARAPERLDRDPDLRRVGARDEHVRAENHPAPPEGHAASSVLARGRIAAFGTRKRLPNRRRSSCARA